jgi:hypothetical protein
MGIDDAIAAFREQAYLAMVSKDAQILRLRTRLHIVEPVYRAAIAAHRNGASAKPGQHERIERLEHAIDRALDTERLVAEGEQPDLSERECPTMEDAGA